MITCPWCGTTYAAYRSPCQKCGGPIPLPARAEQPEQDIAPPPPAPRPIADSYAWKLLFSDGWAVAALVFLLIGGIFVITGVPLVLVVVTAFVGLPFAVLGIMFLVAGAIILNQRLQKARVTVKVLREGQAARGQITNVDMNYSVRVNDRNPWTIQYAFQVMGDKYEGQVTTLNPPGPMIQPGKAMYVLYLPDNPQDNSLYPHP